MRKELNASEYGGIFNDRIKGGVFLTTSCGEKVNSMWLNWANIGYMWRRYCCTIYVRRSRYSAELIQRNPYFSISVPLTAEHHEALRICGKESGRNQDKLAKAGLCAMAGQNPNIPVLDGDNFMHLECRLLHVQKADLAAYDPDIRDFFYAKEPNNPHDAYIAEILAAYKS